MAASTGQWLVVSSLGSVVHFTDTSSYGGAEQMILTLSRGLGRRRWQCILLYHPGPGTERLCEQAKGLDVETLAVAPPSGTRDWPHLARMHHLLRHLRPSIFHAHLTWPLRCSYGIIAAALARRPAVIATQHLLSARGVAGRVGRQRLVGACVHRYVAVSENMGRVLRTALNSEEKVQVIHNGVSLDCLTLPTSQMPDAMPVKSDQPFVLTVARLDPQKGLAYLLSAATCVPGAMFLVAGDGPERGALEAESRRLGLAERVRFLGHREDVPALLRRCDVFVLPSLFEGLPVSVLEAMGAAKPVVATAISGTDEAVVHGETGFLVAAGDPVALAEAIRQLLADPGLARRFGMAGRARVERQFSSETMADRVSEMYGQVLASRRQHATG